MKLTGREIFDLARLAGFEIEEPKIHPEEQWEFEVAVGPAPENGCYDEETGKRHVSRLVAHCDGMECNECQPIGDTRQV